MVSRPSWAEARRSIMARVDPILRLEALPPDQLGGRVLAEDLVQTGCLPFLGRGQTLGAEQLELFRCLGSDEVLVYSQPKVLILEGDGEEDPKSPSLRFLADRIAAFGGVPILERGEDRLEMVRSNVGADLIITRYDPMIDKLGPGLSSTVFEGIAMHPGGGTSLLILEDTPLLVLPSDGPDLLASVLLPLQVLVRQVSRRDDAMPRQSVLGTDLPARADLDLVHFLGRDQADRLAPISALDAEERPCGYIVITARSGGLLKGDRVVYWPI